MILRKALLISAPGIGSRNGSGLNSDLLATRNFLLSPPGGAWKDDEITVLDNPTLKEMLSAVGDMQADYTITFFLGKSFHDSSGNHFLVLREGDYCQDTELLNYSEKQLVLVDAWREFYGEPPKYSPHPGDLDKARRMYDKWIQGSAGGQVIMHGIEGDTLYSNNNSGGIFTQKLLHVACNVPPVENRFNLKSILAAGHETPALMQGEGLEEGPSITYAQGNIRLPFALALPKPLSRLASSNGDDLSSGLALGLLFLMLLFE